MIRGITLYPDNSLRALSKEITPENHDDISKLIPDMFETLHANRGIGLAAIQIGFPYQLFVLDTSQHEGKARVCINPRIVQGHNFIMAKEGCLSFPKEYVEVKRAVELQVVYLDGAFNKVEETLTGLDAVAFQHEYEHLVGVTLADHVGPVKRGMIRDRMNKLYRHLKRGMVQMKRPAQRDPVATVRKEN